MFKFLSKLPFRKSARRPATRIAPRLRLAITAQCLRELEVCLSPARQKRHEGVAYLFGLTANGTTLAVTAFRPQAETTPGSFRVSAAAMAKAVRAAADSHLAVVAQVHTHPKIAYHSQGDIDGANIRYPGFASLVIPIYGDALPSLDRTDILIYAGENGWNPIIVGDVAIVTEHTS
jgi:proteasome lid subunit RPN8/RPN11